MNNFLQEATTQFTACCIEQPRYRVGWLVGVPQRSYKTQLARQLCRTNNWHYLDYTLEQGYFDALADRIEYYQPDDLVKAVCEWCEACLKPVLVIDEIDSILAIWTHTQRLIWAGRVARLQNLPCGVIIVSHFFTCHQLRDYLPDRDLRYCLELPGAPS